MDTDTLDRLTEEALNATRPPRGGVLLVYRKSEDRWLTRVGVFAEMDVRDENEQMTGIDSTTREEIRAEIQRKASSLEDLASR